MQNISDVLYIRNKYHTLNFLDQKFINITTVLKSVNGIFIVIDSYKNIYICKDAFFFCSD